MKWKPADVIAIVVIITSAVLLAMGINGNLAKAYLILIAVYYGIDLTPYIKLGRNQKDKQE